MFRIAIDEDNSVSTRVAFYVRLTDDEGKLLDKKMIPSTTLKTVSESGHTPGKASRSIDTIAGRGKYPRPGRIGRQT